MPKPLRFPRGSSQMELVPGEAVREELSAALLLQVGNVGLEGLVQLPPYCAHSGRQTLVFLHLIALGETHAAEQQNMKQNRTIDIKLRKEKQ